MCSIAGAHDNVERMLMTMNHRSPDGVNVIHGQFQMGMGRLAIIDTKNTRFPFEYKNKILSFNGEIYNYIELRKELEGLGHTFETEGDTEVLLHAYDEWGKECLDKLNGMFAFAILEGDTVFLARDIAGEKPLFFHDQPFKFASEAKALQWKGVEFPPAYRALYSLTEKKFLYFEPWWVFKKRDINLETAEAELEALLEDSIRLRTRSDVPYALYLSDGVDSNLIHSFTPNINTLTYIDKLHDGSEFKELLPRIVWHLDYPIDSFSAFGLWKLAEEAHGDGIKVILSGEGADELFGGYIRYVPYAMNLKARDLYPSYKDMFPVMGDPGFIDFVGKMRGLLRMGDRMASAWGVENRCPFLDRRIIEFAYSLPPELRMYGFDTKIILKRILAKRNPHYVFKEKHGLYCSVNKWLEVDDALSKGAYLTEQNKQWQKFQ